MPTAFSTGYLISNTGRKLNQLLTARFQDAGLTSEQWSVLHQLGLADGITQRELSARTEKDPTNLTRILDQLERRGLVRREPSPDDRRSYRLKVTAEGREIDRRLTPVEAGLIDELLDGVAPEQLAAFRDVITIVNRNMERLRS